MTFNHESLGERVFALAVAVLDAEREAANAQRRAYDSHREFLSMRSLLGRGSSKHAHSVLLATQHEASMRAYDARASARRWATLHSILREEQERLAAVATFDAMLARFCSAGVAR